MARMEHLKKQIETNHRRLQKLEEQSAVYGIDTRPHVLIEIEDIETKIEELQTELVNVEKISLTNPYCGLFAFREVDTFYFFGRETFTKQLVNAVVQRSLVTVLGPSGSGKSSVVFAGLVPKLRSDGSWLIASFRPGNRPFDELADALIPLLEPTKTEVEQLVESQKLADALRNNEVDLAKVVKQILRRHQKARRLLLIADQFEEFYTLNLATPMRRRLLDLLLKSVTPGSLEGGIPLTLILTLRADFLEQALAYRPLADALQGTSEILGPMTRVELRESVERPSQMLGVSFERQLVDRILEDVGDEPGKLPLLEFALTQLWDRQTRGLLTHSAYEEIGRVAGALTHYAEEVYSNLTEQEKEQSQRVFIQMVQPGDGTKDTRRLAARTELDDDGWRLVQRLAGVRLVVTNNDASNKEIVEVVHEALIQNWERLRNWITEFRDFRIWQEKLRAHMKQWQLSQNEEDLLSGSYLSNAQKWLERHRNRLAVDEIAFIERSSNNNLLRKRYAILFFVLAGGLGAAIGVGLITALIGSLAWEPDTPTYFSLPLTFVVFMFGLMGGLWGGVQGAATTLGFVLAETSIERSTHYRRVLGGMLGGGGIGGALFMLFRLTGNLPSGVSYASVCAAGFIIFSLSSGVVTLIIPEIRRLRSSTRQMIFRAFVAGLAAGIACFVAVWLSYQLLDLGEGNPFLEVALFFAPIEIMVGSGMALGLGFASRLGYMLQTTRAMTGNKS